MKRKENAVSHRQGAFEAVWWDVNGPNADAFRPRDEAVGRERGIAHRSKGSLTRNL